MKSTRNLSPACVVILCTGLLVTAAGCDFYQSRLHVRAGNKLMDTGQFVEAIAEYNLALSIDPKSQEAYANKGIAFMSLNQYELALPCFLKQLELAPENPKAPYNLGVAYAAMANPTNDPERYQLALKFLKEGVDRGLDGMSHLQQLGFVYQKLEMQDDAIRTFQRANELYPEIKDFYFSLAISYKKKSDALRAEGNEPEANRYEKLGEDIYLKGLYVDMPPTPTATPPETPGGPMTPNPDETVPPGQTPPSGASESQTPLPKGGAR